MSRLGRGVVALLVGAMAVRLAWTGEFGAFLQQRMRWPLLAGGLAAVLLGLSETIRWDAAGNADPATRRSRVAPNVGWLLCIPVIVLVSVAPTALGASAVDRTDSYAGTERSLWAPLPDRDPVPLPVLEFVDRAFGDTDKSLQGRAIKLTGFVVNDPDYPGGFVLTRFTVACCAADALPVQVGVRGSDEALPDDTWIDAVVVWSEPDAPYGLDGEDWLVEAELVALQVLPQAPDAPYESPY